MQSLYAGQVVPVLYGGTYGCVDACIGFGISPVVVGPRNGSFWYGDDFDGIAVTHGVPFGQGIRPYVINGRRGQVPQYVDVSVVLYIFGGPVVQYGRLRFRTPTETMFYKFCFRHPCDGTPSECHGGTACIPRVGHDGRRVTGWVSYSESQKGCP